MKILQTDFIPLKENILVKKYTFINENNIDLDVKFFIHSGLLSDKNNFVSCQMIDNGMVQYSHDFMFSTIAKQERLYSYQIHKSKKNIKTGIINDKDYIGMSNDSSVEYDVNIIKPNSKKEITICIILQEQPSSMHDFEKEIKDKKILVDFYASWCGPCRMLTEVLESIEDKIDILKVDVDKFPEIARKYGVMSIPNLFLFENNQIIKNQVGFLNENELLDFINEK